MRKSDFTSSIMQKVVSFEKRRSLYFLGKLAFILLVFASTSLFFLWITALELADTGSFDILTIVSQDKEVLREFWQDALLAFWDGLPKIEMTVGISAGVLLVATFFLARKRIKIIRKRLSDVAKYQKRVLK